MNIPLHLLPWGTVVWMVALLATATAIHRVFYNKPVSQVVK